MRRLTSSALRWSVWLLAAMPVLASGAPTLFGPRFEPSSQPGTALALGLETPARLTADGATVRSGHRVFTLENAEPCVEPVFSEDLSGRTQYLYGSDSASWRRDVGRHGRVRFPEIYPGIHAEYHFQTGELEQDFVVLPHGDPSEVRLRLPEGGLTLADSGDLHLQADGREVRLRAPIAWQVVGDERVEVPCRFVRLEPHVFGFDVTRFDEALPLIIDPIVEMSSYIGGVRSQVRDIETAPDGTVYVAGITSDPGWPILEGDEHGPRGGWDVFVSQLSADGREVLWTAYMGGAGDDEVTAITVLDDDVILTGWTLSDDFPTESAFQPGHAGDRDGWVARFDAGTLVLSSYLGGRDDDTPLVVQPCPDGDFIVAGSTFSADYPATWFVFQQSMQGTASSGFVTRIEWNGVVDWSSFLGGSSDDTIHGAAVKPDGTLILAGETHSDDFPGLDGSPNGEADAFVILADFTGTALLTGSYLGGPGIDSARGVVLAEDGRIVVTGSAENGFPTTRPPRGEGIFATVLSADATTMEASFHFGGEGADRATSVGLDSLGRIAVAGQTTSAHFPIIDAVRPQPSGTTDGFVAVLDPVTGGPCMSSYVGGEADDSDDAVYALHVTGATAWVAGTAQEGLMQLAPLGAPPAFGPGDHVGFLTRLKLGAACEPSAVDTGADPPLTITPNDVGGLDLGWEETMGDPQYGIFVGTIYSLHELRAYDHSPGGPCVQRPPASIDMPDFDAYFLLGAIREGEWSSFGRDSFRSERPVPTTPCP